MLFPQLVLRLSHHFVYLRAELSGRIETLHHFQPGPDPFGTLAYIHDTHCRDLSRVYLISTILEVERIFRIVRKILGWFNNSIPLLVISNLMFNKTKITFRRNHNHQARSPTRYRSYSKYKVFCLQTVHARLAKDYRKFLFSPPSHGLRVNPKFLGKKVP
jgi:hypothetical protein